MKNAKKILLILILFIILVYVTNISSIPNNLILMEGEELKLKTILGLSISDNNGETIEAVNSESEKLTHKAGKMDLSVNLAGLNVKDFTVNVIPNTVVIPSGETIGLRLFTSGVLVVGMSEIKGEDNNNHMPYKDSGIKEGDMITKVDNEVITCTSDLTKKINSSNGNAVTLTYKRDGNNYNTNMIPTKTDEDEYKLGLWVRDAASGVGTISFYEPRTGEFAALGHGILDVDTEELIDIARGDIVTSKIISIVKGEKGKPGELQGSIENGKIIGEVYKNTNFGIYGKLNNIENLKKEGVNEMKVMPRDEVKEGKASILCTLENNKQEEYEIEIEKVYTSSNRANKNMIIKVTDERLLQKTGGIIQGMSGSPIIQDGKFVGAVTHVMVNNPEKGYGIFADTMLKQMKEVEGN
ncbi:MAG: SpoIVB peptidase [Clostridia bacterium]|jgi:SpoIVB peptidase